MTDDMLLPKAMTFCKTKSICRIRARSKVFDWMNPENDTMNSVGTGTGFVIDLFENTNYILIITCHHVIANCDNIKVHFNQMSEHFCDAKVVACHLNLDIALLLMDVSHEFAHMQNLKCGTSDNIDLPLRVNSCGFAQGKMHMQITQGAIGAIFKGRLQHDVASNGGNSGGPLMHVDTHRVISMVTSGQPDAQGINYAVGISEIQIWVKRIHSDIFNTRSVYRSVSNSPDIARSPIITHSGQLDASFTTVNPPLLQMFSTDNATFPTGILCINVGDSFKWEMKNGEIMTRKKWTALLNDQHLVSAHKKKDSLRKHDLLTHIIVNEHIYSIDQHGNTIFEWCNVSLPYDTIFDRVDCHAHVMLKGKRLDADKVTDFEVSVQLRHNVYRFREYFPGAEPIAYVTYGGVVVMTLAHNHMKLFSNTLFHIINEPETRSHSALILVSIKADSPFGEVDTIVPGDIIVGVNDKKVQTIEEYKECWEKLLKSDDNIVILTTRDGSKSAASIKHVKEHYIGASFNL